MGDSVPPHTPPPPPSTTAEVATSSSPPSSSSQSTTSTTPIQPSTVPTSSSSPSSTITPGKTSSATSGNLKRRGSGSSLRSPLDDGPVKDDEEIFGADSVQTNAQIIHLKDYGLLTRQEQIQQHLYTSAMKSSEADAILDSPPPSLLSTSPPAPCEQYVAGSRYLTNFTWKPFRQKYHVSNAAKTPGGASGRTTTMYIDSATVYSHLAITTDDAGHEVAVTLDPPRVFKGVRITRKHLKKNSRLLMETYLSTGANQGQALLSVIRYLNKCETTIRRSETTTTTTTATTGSSSSTTTPEKPGVLASSSSSPSTTTSSAASSATTTPTPMHPASHVSGVETPTVPLGALSLNGSSSTAATTMSSDPNSLPVASSELTAALKAVKSKKRGVSKPSSRTRTPSKPSSRTGSRASSPTRVPTDADQAAAAAVLVCSPSLTGSVYRSSSSSLNASPTSPPPDITQNGPSLNSSSPASLSLPLHPSTELPSIAALSIADIEKEAMKVISVRRASAGKPPKPASPSQRVFTTPPAAAAAAPVPGLNLGGSVGRSRSAPSSPTLGSARAPNRKRARVTHGNRQPLMPTPGVKFEQLLMAASSFAASSASSLPGSAGPGSINSSPSIPPRAAYSAPSSPRGHHGLMVPSQPPPTISSQLVGDKLAALKT